MSSHQSNEDDLYYLQTRGYVGNSLMWWKQGKHGYTCDIQQAHVWTKAEAFGQAKVRPTEDFPWPKDYIDAHLQHHVNSQHVSRDPCEGCGAPVFGYVEDRCCDGRECGCMGKPMTPCWCAECWTKWEARSKGGAEALTALQETPRG